jgi:inosine triphosphate pyrophosphatase
MSNPLEITFITGNKNKALELESILNNTLNLPLSLPLSIKIYNLDLPELQGEPEYIATEKCQFASEQIDGPVIIEDTSLCYNALGGLPGPYVKWFLDKTGLNGLYNLLLGYEDKSAYAQTIFAYTEGKGFPIHLFIGKLNGKIVRSRGNLGFGWDPIFQPNILDDDNTFNKPNILTFGQMTPDKKNSISHRYLALQKVKEYFTQL